MEILYCQHKPFWPSLWFTLWHIDLIVETKSQTLARPDDFVQGDVVFEIVKYLYSDIWAKEIWQHHAGNELHWISIMSSHYFHPSTCNCDVLRDLVSFVQFKKCEKYPWRNVVFKPATSLKLALLPGCFSRF